MVKKIDTFISLANLARQTKDNQDIRNAMRFGVENRISTKNIRKYL
jgi:hypothetical protein